MNDTELITEHKVCEQNVAAPTILIVRFTPETDREEAKFQVEDNPLQPLELNQRREVNIQWFGEAARIDLGERQFRFPVPVLVDDMHWWDQPQSFRVIFLGPVKRWVKPEAVSDFAASLTNGNLDSVICWVASTHYGIKHSDGPGPASFTFRMSIMLGDGVVGVIMPRFFSDLTILERMNEEFRRQSVR